MMLNKDKLFAGLGALPFCLLALIFFPWVSFSTNSFDTQPWIVFFIPLYFLLLFVFGKKIYWDRYLLLLLVVFFLSVCSVFLFTVVNYDVLDFSIIRVLASYLIFFIAIVFLYDFAIKNLDKIKYVIFYFNGVWLFFGFLQVVLGKYIFTFLVAVRTSDERGVTSLAPEPTFFGLVLLFFNLFYLIFSQYKLFGVFKYLFFVNCFFIFFVAKSALALILLFVLFFLILVKNVSALTALKLIFAGVLIFFVFVNFLSSTRIYTIFSIVLDGGFLKLLLVDQSVLSRFLSVIYPYYIGFKNNLLPGGFYGFESFGQLSISIDGSYITYMSSNKIMSYFGAVFFEMGFLTLSLYLIFFYCIFNGTFFSVVEFFSIYIILLNALTIAFTFVPLLLVLFLIKRKGFI